ncbi:MAG: helix-turn-helix domain-containing protein, partial [Kaistella sp.]
NYKYLYQRIVKEYDTKKLVAEKNRIESTLQTQRIVFASVFVVASLGFLFFGFRIYNEKQNYKKRFEEIIAQQNNTEVLTESLSVKDGDFQNTQKFDYDFYNKIPGLNPIFVENILKQLEDFEKEEKFLDVQISQKSLSEELGTNSTYFSKIINTYKGKNFTLYINDLRLDYIIKHLKNDVKYLNMDVKELASIAGFSSTENFSDNFRRKFDLKPSVFIKMMKGKL